MEYDGFVMDNKDKKVNKSKDIKMKETTKSAWDNGRTFKAIEDIGETFKGSKDTKKWTTVEVTIFQKTKKKRTNRNQMRI